jgi:DNA (cytosine-5)-methyltransferase 1
MKFLSLCSGIDAASVASAPLGWECVGFSEIEPFPCAVLAHRYPSVTNFGDMTKYAEWPEQLFIDADAIVGGPPCQAFSMAGKREGLDDARGNLTLIYANLIDHADRIRAAHGKSPVWCLYENVPGLLSDRTNAFGCLLGKLAGEDVPLLPTGGKWTNAGFVSGSSRSIAWRILDAQYFGVAQRRRRVFVVAGSGNFDPAKVLFEFDGVRRNTPPRREAGQGDSHDLAPCLTSSRAQRVGDPAGQDSVVSGVLGFNVNAQADEFRADPDTAASLTRSQRSGVLHGPATCFKIRGGCAGGG